MNTNENKALIWNLLQNNGHFNNISSDKFKDVQTSFENTVSHVYNNQSGESIIELNKIVIKLFIDKLNYFKQKEVKEGNNSNLESISNLKSEMADEINNNFNLKKQELEDSMKREVPNEIDFTISKDEPIKEDIDKLINNVITNRNLEINTILKSQAKPENKKQKKNDLLNKILENQIVLLNNQQEILKLLKK